MSAIGSGPIPSRLATATSPRTQGPLKVGGRVAEPERIKNNTESNTEAYG